eukprot:2118079-Ditylum_brightwellii.AAC.1
MAPRQCVRRRYLALLGLSRASGHVRSLDAGTCWQNAASARESACCAGVSTDPRAGRRRS